MPRKMMVDDGQVITGTTHLSFGPYKSENIVRITKNSDNSKKKTNRNVTLIKATALASVYGSIIIGLIVELLKS